MIVYDVSFPIWILKCLDCLHLVVEGNVVHSPWGKIFQASGLVVDFAHDKKVVKENGVTAVVDSNAVRSWLTFFRRSGLMPENFISSALIESCHFKLCFSKRSVFFKERLVEVP